MPLEHTTRTSRSNVPSPGRLSPRSNSNTVMGRGASFTSSPERTRAYERTPSTLIAETDEGTCMISPVNAAIPAAICSSRTAATSSAGAVPVTSPSASSVRVHWPRRIVASYSFCVRVRCPSSRVARSTPSTRTPVAIGSSVPAWPTRRVPTSRRILPTTSCEVQPPGLSTMTRPSGGAGRSA